MPERVDLFPKLCDHLGDESEPDQQEVHRLEQNDQIQQWAKAEALDEIAYNLLTTSGRNYLHTYAQELRSSVEGDER